MDNKTLKKELDILEGMIKEKKGHKENCEMLLRIYEAAKTQIENELMSDVESGEDFVGATKEEKENEKE